jgi:hypothetical protein
MTVGLNPADNTVSESDAIVANLLQSEIAGAIVKHSARPRI